MGGSWRSNSRFRPSAGETYAPLAEATKPVRQPNCGGVVSNLAGVDEYDRRVLANVRLRATTFYFSLCSCNVLVSTRGVVRPIGLDMVEVGGSSPPGPIKFSGLCFFIQLFFRTVRFGLSQYMDTTEQK